MGAAHYLLPVGRPLVVNGHQDRAPIVRSTKQHLLRFSLHAPWCSTGRSIALPYKAIRHSSWPSLTTSRLDTSPVCSSHLSLSAHSLPQHGITIIRYSRRCSPGQLIVTPLAAFPRSPRFIKASRRLRRGIRCESEAVDRLLEGDREERERRQAVPVRPPLPCSLVLAS